MALKTFKPYTKSTRGTVVVDKSNLWKGSSYKPLTRGQHVTGGRNNAGRITSRHMGGGSKHKFRNDATYLQNFSYDTAKQTWNTRTFKGENCTQWVRKIRPTKYVGPGGSVNILENWENRIDFFGDFCIS